MKFFDGFFQNKKETWIQIGLIFLIVILLNLLAINFVWRLDMTSDNQYTLSKASVDIAKELTDPITIEIYFSEGLPPQLAQVKQQFQSFLEEFGAYSGGNIEFKFINPNENEELEMQAQQKGIQPVVIDVRERDQISQKRAYLGALFKYGEKQEIIPIVQPGAAMEYLIASTVKKLTTSKKPKVGLFTGAESLPQAQMPQLIGMISELYEIKEVINLDTDSTEVPADIDILMVIGSKAELNNFELYHLDQYLMRGGKIIFAVERIHTEIQRGLANVNNNKLERLLSTYQISVSPNLIVDAQSGSVGIQEHSGIFNFVNQVQYPYLPIISSFADHPISSGLESILFQFVSTVNSVSNDSLISITPLAFSSAKSGIRVGNFNISPMQDWNNRNFTESGLVVAALAEGSFPSYFADNDTLRSERERSIETAIMVIGDASFLDNGIGQQQQRMPDDNINLVANAVDYLADESGLSELRTKGITNRPIEILEDSTKTTLKYANVFLPIFLVIGYGFIRYQRRKAQRRIWQTDGV